MGKGVLWQARACGVWHGRGSRMGDGRGCTAAEGTHMHKQWPYRTGHGFPEQGGSKGLTAGHGLLSAQT